MTLQAPFDELLNRLAALQGATVYLGSDELNSWSTDAVDAMKSARLLVKARHASRLLCPGCERQCTKPVQILPVEGTCSARAFIACDEPEDMGRVPVDLQELERWRITGEILAGTLNRLLGFVNPLHRDRTGRLWILGLLRGKKRKGEIKLSLDDGVNLFVAGHSVTVADIVTIDSSGLSANREELLRLVDRPASNTRYEASTTQREVRKRETQARYNAWRRAATELRRKAPGKSERWVALQIEKLDIANGTSAETIRKHLRQ